LRNAWVAYAKPEIIGETAGWQETYKARSENKAIDRKLEKERSRWKLRPPSNMKIILHQDSGTLPGGVLISVRPEVGRMLLHRRLATIVERDMTPVRIVTAGLEDVLLT